MKSFLDPFFNYCNESDFSYCVLRNYESLPETIPGSDIDILIHKNDAKLAVKWIEQWCSNSSFSIVAKYEKTYKILHLKLFDFEHHNGISLDFIYGIGADYIDALKINPILMNRVQFKTFYIPQKSDETLVLLAQNWFSRNAKIKERYLSDIQAMSKNQEFKDRLKQSKILSQKLQDEFIQNIDDLDRFNRWIKHSRSRIRKRSILRKPFSIIPDLFSFIRIVVSRIFNKQGRFIVLLGPDGSGKSTLTDLLLEHHQDMYKGIEIEHLHPKIMPRLKDLRNASDDKPQRTEWEERNQKKSVFSSLIRLGYYSVIYFFGYFIKIVPSLIKGRLVVYDRYFYDYIIDPKSKGINLPLFLRKLFVAMLPGPHFIFYISVPATIIHDRKPELPVEELEKQNLALENMTNKKSKMFKIDNSQNPEDAVKELLHIILKGS